MEQLYAKYRRLLFTLAYQLTGTQSDAEDIVQDVFVKLMDVPPEKLLEPKAYLCKMVTNRSLDFLKSARKKRELYTGEWLPEPLRTSESEDLTFELVSRSDLLSYGMLVMLEVLSPSERAVFVLREALGLEYEQIAQVVDKQEATCRKLLSRAKSKLNLQEETPVNRVEADSKRWVQQFLGALQQGEVDRIMALLAEDIVLVSDGGGKVSAAIHPIVSRQRVFQFLMGLLSKAGRDPSAYRMEVTSLNGQWAFVLHDVKAQESTAVLLQAGQDQIQRIYLIRNPDKLRHIIGQ